jgi:putative oxidoreductase
VMVEHLVTFLVRLTLCILFFPFSALDKVLNFKGAVGQAHEFFSWKPLAVAAIFIGLGVEIFASLGVITGVADRLCAFVLGGYCFATAVLWKQFWRPGDFWAGGKGRDLFWDFLKNFSLGAGILLVMTGTAGEGVHAFLADPLGSTHPYSQVASHD